MQDDFSSVNHWSIWDNQDIEDQWFGSPFIKSSLDDPSYDEKVLELLIQDGLDLETAQDLVWEWLEQNYCDYDNIFQCYHDYIKSK